MDETDSGRAIHGSAFLDGLFALNGRVAIVTGGSSGIGRAIAESLAQAGADVVVVARGEAALRETVDGIRAGGHRAAFVSADLGERAEVERAGDEAAAVFGEPDILVHAAGINLRPPLADLTVQDWDLTMALNLDAAFLLGQRFGPGMAERGWGRIITIGSQQSIRAFGNSGAYGVSKAAVAALARSQAEAWSARGVCCNAIAPGFVRTPLTEAVFTDPAREEALAARTMAGRNGQPADFMGVAIFLASDASAYVTGQLIFVDGGFSVF
ncbi:SDR family NAD(P)-dependent oxidoreductase [Actinopolymorpha alba]|uniref:SDR family NAD(P)-dependent oxidoreductase n=1 Tax=Actinopolymorpha alba TaxID=533267 RepID=UPI0003681882|nr:SDR family oxidoreductase [Actinopolymorpha alba]